MKRRSSPPPSLSPEEKAKGDWDYAYVYANDNIHKICGTTTVLDFVNIQHLKWTAHVIHMDNNTLEKQTLFMEGKDVWKGLEKTTGMDRMQLRKIMFNKQDFGCFLKNFQGTAQM